MQLYGGGLGLGHYKYVDALKAMLLRLLGGIQKQYKAKNVYSTASTGLLPNHKPVANMADKCVLASYLDSDYTMLSCSMTLIKDLQGLKHIYTKLL